MQTRLNLLKYEALYDTFDKGHDRKHLEEVRNFAVKLAEKYCPDKVELAYVAGSLHDIGISVARDGHEKYGYEMLLKDKDFKKCYSQNEQEEILEAVREHRASTGNPQGLIAKIVSDADKVCGDSNRAMNRAYEWGLQNVPGLDDVGQILRAANHLKEKFGENGTGTRLYFDESREKLRNTFEPIFEALDKGDLKSLENMVELGKS